MAIAPSSLTLEQFLQLPEEKPAIEFVDGMVRQKMSPKTRHSILQTQLAALINAVALPRRQAQAFCELRVTFAGESHVPDVSVISWDRIPTDDEDMPEDDVRLPPDIAVEIVSPGQSVNWLIRRCTWYVDHGVAVALLIDPDDRSVLAVRPEHNVVVWRENDRIDLDEVLPGFLLTVAELFATLPVRRKPRAG